MQLAALWLIAGRINDNWNYKEGVLSVVRKTLPSLKASALRDFEEIMWKTGYMGQIKINKSNLTYTNGERTVEFFSVDNQQKVRSRKRTILIAIEANELDFRNDFNQLSLRTTDRVILDFNPDDEDIWINTELEQKRSVIKGDVEVIVSTYKDNPFLDRETIAEIEYLAQVDPELWEVFGRGNYGKITGLIFPPPKIITEMPEVKSKIYGLDFGFNDPTALYEIGLCDPNIYLNEIIYERFLTTAQIAEMMREAGISNTDTIYADSASPGQIQELYNLGFRGIKPAQKGADSILAGIVVMKRFAMHITASSQNGIKEFRKYKWATDKNGNNIDGKPIDAFNHAIDACRYGIFSHYYKPKPKMRIA